MTGNGPEDSTLTLVLYLYQSGFRFFRVGYASAIAVALFLCTLVLTLAKRCIRDSYQVAR